MANFPETPVTVLARIAAEHTGARDEVAWARLFELYAPAIRAFAADHGGIGEEEDVAQEIFMRLVEVLRSNRVKIGDGAVKFRCYLATLIRNELVDRWRRRNTRGGDNLVSIDDPSIETQLSVDPEALAVIDAKWRLARRTAAVEWALSKTALSAQSKAVYRAYVLESRPIEEVAAEFGIPRNSVSQIRTRVERMISAIEAEFQL
jgi:RNA polymerase sigma factor (sigma-70 family)